MAKDEKDAASKVSRLANGDVAARALASQPSARQVPVRGAAAASRGGSSATLSGKKVKR